MPKGLIKTLINQFLDLHNLNDIQAIFDRSPELYKFLKTHELKPLQSNCSYDIFMGEMQIGVQQAQMRQMMGQFRR